MFRRAQCSMHGILYLSETSSQLGNLLYRIHACRHLSWTRSSSLSLALAAQSFFLPRALLHFGFLSFMACGQMTGTWSLFVTWSNNQSSLPLLSKAQPCSSSQKNLIVLTTSPWNSKLLYDHLLLSYVCLREWVKQYARHVIPSQLCRYA